MAGKPPPSLPPPPPPIPSTAAAASASASASATARVDSPSKKRQRTAVGPATGVHSVPPTDGMRKEAAEARRIRVGRFWSILTNDADEVTADEYVYSSDSTLYDCTFNGINTKADAGQVMLYLSDGGPSLMFYGPDGRLVQDIVFKKEIAEMEKRKEDGAELVASLIVAVLLRVDENETRLVYKCLKSTNRTIREIPLPL